MRRSTWGWLGLLLIARAASAQTEAWDDAKPAWKWTLEERLAKRFDPAEVTARSALAEKQMREQLATFPRPWPKEPGETDEALIESAKKSIHGRDTPELFTPMELFMHFFEAAYPVDDLDPRPYREMLEEEAAALGFGADLWPRLRRVASPYLRIIQENHRVAVAEGLMMGPTPPEVLCRVRVDALEAALDEFGREAFLEFLYEVVAPPMGSSMLTPDSLRRWEGDCLN